MTTITQHTAITQHAPGTFSWADLGTTDAAAAKQFYMNLFGWDAIDEPAGEHGTYTMFQIDGKSVAALYQQGPEEQAQGIPPAWLSYFTVANADESAQKVQALGGSMMAEPFDVMNSGRMGLVQDPTGAVFAIWEPRDSIGAQLKYAPHTLCWNELMTKDKASSETFYTSLFDWTSHKGPAESGDYTFFVREDQQCSGMMEIAPEWGDVPPHWMLYFAVEDCDAIAEKAQALGGTLNVPPTDIPLVGRFAMIQDPQGAFFSIIKMLE